MPRAWWVRRVAGLLLAVVGEGTCFLINGFSFLGGDCLPAAMRLPPVSPAAHVAIWQPSGGRLPIRRRIIPPCGACWR